jgi:prespore-specific protein
MEDIKKLYQEAKAYGAIHSKSNSVLRNYMEAVDRIASNSPKEYISNLEYIISSSYGANTFSSFLEKHKVPLSYIPKIKNVIKKLKNKNEDNKLSDTYSDMISVMESYENKYSNCMDMAIYFEDCLDDRYLEAYYTNFPKLSNKNVNISKFLERYGNGCIADMIVYTEANKALLENVYDQMVDKKKKLSNNQWIKDSLKDFSYVDNEILDVFTKESLEYQVNQALENNEQAFRESVMMGMQMVSPFTESDVRNMEDYILYQEYKLCGAKNESERTLIMESINRTKKALEPLMIEEDVADSVIPMLPGTRVSKPILSKQFASVLAMESSFTEATKYPEQKRSRFNKKPRSGSEVIQYIEDVDNDKFKEWFFKTPAGSKLNKKTFNFKSLVDDEQNIDSVGYVFKNEIVAIATINNARSKTNKVNICAVHPRHKGCLVNLFRLIDSRWISDTTVELNKSTQKEFVDAFQSIGYEITLERGQVVTLSRKKKTKGTVKTESVSFTEALSSNTRNKKTGKAPGYLKNNHDLSYGEDDDTDNSDDVGDDIFGDHIDDTPKEKKTSKTDPEPYQYDDIDDDSPDNAEKDKPASGANYYYYNYNYTNSNNTSSKSHNDYSTHTSHDSHDKKYHTINNTNSNNVTKTVDSHNQKNDNSTNKRVHSHDYGDHHEESVQLYHEEVGDADDNKPESDNPIRDTMMDIDQKVSEGIGSLKRGAGKVRQTARAVTKPFKRVLNFIDAQIEKWRDSNENDIKEQLADPHQSNSLIKAFKSAVKYGAIYKAGLLLNPIFIFLAAAKHLDSRNNKFRIRNEMIGELKTELQVLEEKIKDADANKDRKAKYQMMRLKNELTKKLIRVGGTGDMKNMI